MSFSAGDRVRIVKYDPHPYEPKYLHEYRAMNYIGVEANVLSPADPEHGEEFVKVYFDGNELDYWWFTEDELERIE
jgi:hypothetical protein